MKMNKTSEKTTLIVERVIDAPVIDIFRALTKESKLRQWFYPIQRGFSVEVKFDAAVGGSYQIEMIDPDGKVYEHKGVIRDLFLTKSYPSPGIRM